MIPPVEMAKMVEQGQDMARLTAELRRTNELLAAIVQNTKPAVAAPEINPTDKPRQ
jgi:hypothetical protein